MAPRILLVDGPGPLVAAVPRDLEERGCEVVLASPANPAARVARGAYGVALVRAAPDAAAAVAALRAADPSLPIVVLALDADEAATAGALEADGLLVGPLTASAVGTACDLAGRLREATARAAALEAALASGRAGRDLDFLKRLLILEVKRSRRYGHPLSLAIVAVDGWPALAAKLPARARTALLAELLAAVAASLRDIDLAVPHSDGRLVVMMPHTGADGALRVARRLSAAVRELPGRPRVTASVGVASHGGDGTVSFGALVKRAGAALERARAHGGDRAEPAEPARKRERISIG